MHNGFVVVAGETMFDAMYDYFDMIEAAKEYFKKVVREIGERYGDEEILANDYVE